MFDTILGIIAVILLIAAAIGSIAIIVIGRDRNEFIFAAIYAVLMSLIYLFATEAEGLSILIIPIIYYICSFIAFKLTNAIDPDNIIMYVIIWQVIHYIAYFFFNLMFSML